MGSALFITAKKAGFCAQIMTNFCSIQIEFQFKGEWRVLHFFGPLIFMNWFCVSLSMQPRERAPLFPSAACF
jgi:hypothetical protein